MDLPKTTALDLSPPDPLPEDVAELFGKCQHKLGLIPNVLVAYAHRPEKLRAFAAMYNDLMLGESGLSKLEREMIAVAVSAENRCWYCLVAHGAAVREMSGDPALGEHGLQAAAHGLDLGQFGHRFLGAIGEGQTDIGAPAPAGKPPEPRR